MRSNEERLIISLRDISHTMRTLYEGRGSQKRVLMLLHRTGTITQRDLTQLLGIQPGSASEVIAKLEHAGLVRRTASTADRRMSVLTLTEAGQQRAAEAVRQRKQRHQEMFSSLSEEERTQLLVLLEKLSADWAHRYSKIHTWRSRLKGQNRGLFGRLADDTPVEELTLRDGPCSCQIITYGAAVRTLTVPDRAGRAVDVVLGFDTLEDYLAQDKYIGALVGRYANRIGGSRFSLDGQDYPLAANDGGNHLHGGLAGFDKQVWRVEELDRDRAVLSLTSPHGQEGYPGRLEVTVTYILREGALSIDYRAVSDKATPCSLTNHSYFNLSGHGSGRVEDQYIQLLASRYTPTGPDSIPTGEILPVEGTPMDLRTPQPIGAQIGQNFPQLLQAGGYDHNWAADGWDGSLRPVAQAWSPVTGIAMETSTTLPGVQFYTGNHLTGCPLGKGGIPYSDRHAFCLETQYFPDSPNRPAFPSSILRPGEEYHSQTVYRFRIQEGPDRATSFGSDIRE